MRMSGNNWVEGEDCLQEGNSITMQDVDGIHEVVEEEFNNLPRDAQKKWVSAYRELTKQNRIAR